MVAEYTKGQPQPTWVAAECVAARVLVLDDDPSFRRLARAILEPDGFEVIESRDLRECLLQLGEQTTREQAIDVVVLDMVMPEHDGFDALRELNALFPKTPVVAVSGAAQSELYLTLSTHLGADASLEKSQIGALGPLLRVVLNR
jgi:CheY-like chemotaxis protein